MPLPSQNPLQKIKPNLQKKALNAADPFPVARHLAQQAAQQWQNFLQGLYRYQHTTLPRHTWAWKTVAQHQSAALLYLPATVKRKNIAPVVLVPSLINRFHILDLSPDQSFISYLRQQGHAVYLLDWHHDLDKSLPATLDGCITHYLLPLLHKIPEKHYHLLGYCMGGTLSMAAGILHSQPLLSLTLVATPWDFHQPDTNIGKNISRYLQDIKKQSPQHSLFKSDWLQMLFWRHDPLTALHKFQRFAALTPGSAEADTFIRAEDWLNDGIDLPISLLDDCVQSWYHDNRTAKGTWEISGKTITPSALDDLPIQLITATRDGLVPPASSAALKTRKTTSCTEFDTGHIGLFAGRKSKTAIWPQLQQFLSHHNTR